MWTYLTQPFSFTLPGLRTTELDPWEEAGQHWRRLPSLATYSAEQTLYFTPDGFVVRHDYDVEISGGATAAHYLADYLDIDDIVVATKHRILPRDPRRRVAGRTAHRLDRSQRDHVQLRQRFDERFWT